NSLILVPLFDLKFLRRTRSTWCRNFKSAARPGGSSAAARASVANDRRKVGTMADIRVPALGESVTEATIGKWFKRPGDPVAVDEPLVELETDKVTIEVPAPAAGVLAEIAAKDGETVAVGALLGQIKDGGAAKAAPSAQPAAPQPAAPPPAPPKASAQPAPPPEPRPAPADAPLAPSVRRLAAESSVDPAAVAGSGKDGRVTKGDMLAEIERAAARPTPVPQPAAAVQV